MDFLPAAVLQRVIIPGVVVPGAGVDWTVTLPSSPGSLGWLLKSVQATLTQGASGTPQPVLVIDDGGGHTIAESVGATSPQASSTTVLYSWGSSYVQSGLQGATSDVHSQAPLPMGADCFLLPGFRIRTHTLGITALSQWSAIVLLGVANQ